jgi:hypothetical protein
MPRSFLLLCLAAALSAADGAPAVITKLSDKPGAAGNAFETAFVLSESVDGIEFVVDDAKSQDKLTLKYGSYTVVYGDPNSVDYLRGKNLEESGDFSKASDTFKRAAGNAKYAWVKEQSLVHGAQAAIKAKQPDLALELIAVLEKDAPRSIELDDALLLRGQVQAAKGDAAGAAKTFASLSGMAKEWGESAAVFGARGQAGVLIADKKFAEGADVLAKLLARIGQGKSTPELATLRLDLADALTGAGKGDEALKLLPEVAYRDVGGDLQSRAHLTWARIQAAKPDAASQLDAFDHAAMADATKGAESATLNEARKIAATVVEKLTKDPAVSAADKAEYKKNLGNF